MDNQSQKCKTSVGNQGTRAETDEQKPRRCTAVLANTQKDNQNEAPSKIEDVTLYYTNHT